MAKKVFLNFFLHFLFLFLGPQSNKVKIKIETLQILRDKRVYQRLEFAQIFNFEKKELFLPSSVGHVTKIVHQLNAHRPRLSTENFLFQQNPNNGKKLLSRGDEVQLCSVAVHVDRSTRARVVVRKAHKNISSLAKRFSIYFNFIISLATKIPSEKKNFQASRHSRKNSIPR